MKRVLALSIFASSLVLGACSGGTAAQSTDSTAQSAAAATKAPVAAQVKAPRVRMVADALGDVALRPEQRTEIESMAKDADTRAAAGRQAHVDLANAVAAQIEAGRIDRAALQPKIDAAVAAFEASRPADSAALERLHAILSPDQRAAFVDAMRARMKAAHEAHEAGHEHHGMHAHMQEWATALKLTDDQKQQIHQIFADGMKAHHSEMKEMKEGHEGHHGHGEVLEAFKGDTFTAPTPPADAKAHVAAMADHILGVAEKVLPLLTPEQRKIAADRIREHAASGDLGHFE
jgi:Spy/CpxP family protein refolding chaperone